MQQPCEVCKALGVPPLTSLMLKVRTVFQENVNVRVLEEKILLVFRGPARFVL